MRFGSRVLCFLGALVAAAVIGTAQEKADPRVGLKPGLKDAGQAAWNMALVASLYPPDHPYHWLTIGQAEDLRAATLEDVRAFFQTYYHPANASLAIAGDIAADEAFALVRQYFEEIPAGERPTLQKLPPAAIASEQRLLIEDRVELPRIYMVWHTPALFADGDAELDLISEIFAGGKTSRLYRTLVYDARLATEIATSQNSRELGSFFQVVATAAPRRLLSELERAINREFEQFIAHGPDERELERAMAQAEAHFVQRLQTVGGFGGKSDQLNAYAVFLNDPGYLPRDLQRYRAATADTLGESARRFLGHDRRVVLSVVPVGRADLAVPGSQPVEVS